MNKKTSKLFITCLISFFLLLMSAQQGFSGFERNDYWRVHIFGFELFNVTNFEKYYFSYRPFIAPCYPGNEQNIEEWHKRYPDVDSIGHFHEVIYQMECDTLDLIYQSMISRKNYASDNQFVKALLHRKDRAALQYLVYAKACEPLVVDMGYRDWEYEARGEDSLRVVTEVMNLYKNLLDEGLKAWKKEKDVFLKQRYGFQLVRLAFSMNEYKACLRLFDQLMGRATRKNYIYYRTLMHKGFALKRLGRGFEANYALAEVYEKEPSLRCLAYNNMTIAAMNEAGWQKFLATANTGEQKTLVLLLRNIDALELSGELLNNVFAFNPSGNQAELLMLKEVARLEASVLLPRLYKPSTLDVAKLTFGENYPEDKLLNKPVEARKISWWKLVLKKITRFFKSLFKSEDDKAKPVGEDEGVHFNSTPEGKSGEKELKDAKRLSALEKYAFAMAGKVSDRRKAVFYHLVAAYAQIIKGDYKTADATLAKAKAFADGLQSNDLMGEQTTYLQALSAVMAADSITPALEQQVYELTAPLWKHIGKQAPMNAGWQKMLLFSEMGRRYMVHNDVHKAILAFHTADYRSARSMLMDVYASPDETQQLIDYIKNPPQLSFDLMFVNEFNTYYKRFLSDGSIEDLLYEVQGTKLARLGKFSQAAQQFAKISPGYLKRTPVEHKYDSLRRMTLWGAYEPIVEEYEEEGLYDSQWGVHIFKTSFETGVLDSQQVFKQYDKFVLVREIAEIQKEAIKLQNEGAKEEAAALYFKIGNALYHSSWWAYNEVLWCNSNYDQWGRLITGLESFDPVSYPFNLDNISTTFHNRKMNFVRNYCLPYHSIKSYEKALMTTQDPETAAKALFCAKSAAKQFFNTYWDEQIKLNSDQYLYMLAKDYRNTDFYEYIIEECPTVKEFEN